MQKLPLESEWKKHLTDEFSKDYMKNLKSFLMQEEQSNNVFPTKAEYFQAFNLTPFDQVKVVILGQDPYHGPDQAHGLCFSVKPGVKVPPSLVNVYKELSSDVDFEIPNHGYLKSWAEQGVLLLNATLSVRAGEAGSHQKKGWEQFTDHAIQSLDSQRQNIVFMLWGAYAQKKGHFIDTKKHLVLKAPHPSPLSAHRGFLGCKHFSKSNEYLKKHGIEPIHWQLPISVEY